MVTTAHLIYLTRQKSVRAKKGHQTFKLESVVYSLTYSRPCSTLKQATGGILPPSADFTEVRKLAKQIEKQFFQTLLTIILGFENR